MHHSHTRTRRRNSWRHVAALTLLFLQAACFVPHAQMVRDAQDAFSQGAALDNRAKLGVRDGLESSDPFYSAAYGLIENALREAEPALREDDLYGTAMTIKALAAWRLGDLAEARATAAAVVELAAAGGDATKVWPRDRAVCAALDGLIGVDLLAAAARRIKAERLGGDELQSLLIAEVEQVDAALTAAARELPDDHRLRLYLTQSRAELAHVVRRGITNVHPPGSHRAAAAATYRALRAEVLAEMQGQRDAPQFDLVKDSLAAAVADYERLLDTVTDGR